MEFIRFVFKISVEFEIYLKKIKSGRAHLSAVHLPFNQATQLPGPIHACHRADHQVVTVLTTGRALAPVIANRVPWWPYPRAHGSRGEPSIFSPTHTLSPLYTLSPRHPLCSPVPPPTVAPYQRLCQGSAPLSPPHQLEPVCNSKRQLSRSPATSSSRCSSWTTVSRRSPVEPRVPQALCVSAIHCPLVRAAAVLFTATEFLAINPSLR
jgi:hypothetical protein